MLRGACVVVDQDKKNPYKLYEDYLKETLNMEELISLPEQIEVSQSKLPNLDNWRKSK